LNDFTASATPSGQGGLMLRTLIILTSILVMTCSTFARAPVTLAQRDGRWTVRRDGIPYPIHGVGGPWRLKLLADRGGNSARTWGVGRDTGKMLDEAHANGISITLCIWVPHKGKDFNWADPEFLNTQLQAVRDAAETHRSHPAVLMWSIGNEAENANPDYWHFVEKAAALVKQLDPDHPVMTIVAEIGGDKAIKVRDLCPSIDLLGVNTCAGLPSLPQRLDKQGWTNPTLSPSSARADSGKSARRISARRSNRRAPRKPVSYMRTTRR
jgi:Glycosyl hydrolases family 2, TIM barrel domain